MFPKATLIATVTLALLAASVPINPKARKTSILGAAIPIFNLEEVVQGDDYMISKYHQCSILPEKNKHDKPQKGNGTLSTVKYHLLNLSRSILMKRHLTKDSCPSARPYQTISSHSSTVYFGQDWISKGGQGKKKQSIGQDYCQSTTETSYARGLRSGDHHHWHASSKISCQI